MNVIINVRNRSYSLIVFTDIPNHVIYRTFTMNFDVGTHFALTLIHESVAEWTLEP